MRPSWLEGRAGAGGVALETTLLAHGVPRDGAMGLASRLMADVGASGATPAVVGVLGGRAIVGMTGEELGELLASGDVRKVNTSNLGVALAGGWHGATTVSATMEIAAAAGVRVFATGGIGGVHRGYAEALDVSSDLMALARFPVAVVASGVKSILDVESTREALETLGVPVIGYRTDSFPAFYVAESRASVDERFDDVGSLARFVRLELERSGRGILVAHPPPAGEAIDAARMEAWLGEATRRAHGLGARGRDLTPVTLSALHEVSGGATLRVNVALARSNARLAGRLAAAMEGGDGGDP
jgi:pseudouridine-5'-phosphate glycosidase